MDQIKPILIQIKKHHFWILSGIVAVLCVVFGYLGTKHLSDTWHARESTIKSAFSTARRVAAIENHPNDDVAKEMEAVNRALAEEVYAAWQVRFARQKEILTWPVDVLGQDFISRVEKLQPIEATVPFPEEAGWGLQRNIRARYMNNIHLVLPELAEKIKARWTAGKTTADGGGGPAGSDGGGGGPAGGGPGGGFDFGGGGTGMNPGDEGGGGAAPATDENPYVVEWDSGNQSSLKDRFDWPDGKVPSIAEILYAQEDLWILNSIMDIISRTNGDADAQYNAAVKVIQSIRLGAEAGGIKDGGKVSMVESAASGSSMYGMSGNSSSSGSNSSSSAGMAGPGTGYSTSSTAAQNDPADNRYVDAKYVPVKGEQLRTTLKSDTPSDAFLVVAKRMPVRLELKVDVTKLPRLLAECGNARLTFEVRQVRINPQAKTQAGAASGGGGGGGGMDGGGNGPAGMGSGMGADISGSGGGPGGGDEDGGYGGMGGMAGASAAQQDSPYDAEVEIYGLIYLYNPPQRKKLGLPDEDQAQEQAQAANQTAGAAAGG